MMQEMLLMTLKIRLKKKIGKTWFLALLGLTEVKGTSLRNKVAKKGRKGETQHLFWEPFLIKNRSSQNHKKNDHPKTWNLMPKGCQNGTKIDAQTHQNSMPKLVTKKVMKIIKNHVSLNGKIIEFHCKNKCF